MRPDPAGVTPQQAIEIVLTVVGVSVGALAIAVVLGWVLMGFALMGLFRKTGVKPWIAWVPVYRTWVWLELGGQPGWVSLLSLVGGGTVTSVFLYLAIYRIGLAFRQESGFLVLGIFLTVVWAFILGGRASVYEPGLLAWHGFPPPRVGYGSVTPSFATDPRAVPTPS
ncbi:hypothetical protein ITJ64_06420 [Herbiconiux sp. VKM Ac-1786]|uniref:DUF5684 domain-containing protein n=1 Tax=Herbiconiux sp. VKM Ac-1786 TaxID=2783824 RepID=UPI00188DBBB0|nr:DUF5684 domain-containing protein [Herbiconiux sp. VKM Ac-1786]MBF4572147.1 hypothetical protein [Herbiconiux sp. VKM Ac-1786]